MSGEEQGPGWQSPTMQEIEQLSGELDRADQVLAGARAAIAEARAYEEAQARRQDEERRQRRRDRAVDTVIVVVLLVKVGVIVSLIVHPGWLWSWWS